MLNFAQQEVFQMTLRKFFLIYDQYLELNGMKEKEVTVDQVF